jgi:hypothetical protein
MSDAVSRAAANWRAKLRRREQAPQRARIKIRQQANQSKWEEAMNDAMSVCQYPAWEIIFLADEPLYEWQARWEVCGGTLYAARMIAGKLDSIWEKLSSMFPDGLDKPYPPFARSSNATWKAVGCAECERIGVKLDSATRAAVEQAENELRADLEGISLGDLRAARDELLAQAKRLRGV